MRHISVSKSPTFTGQVREVFHQATPAHGQRLAAHLIESLPRCPIPKIARLGADPTQVEGRTRRLLRHRRSQQRANRSHQRNHRTRQTHRQKLPQPHQLPTPNAPHRRRPRPLQPTLNYEEPHNPTAQPPRTPHRPSTTSPTPHSSTPPQPPCLPPHTQKLPRRTPREPETIFTSTQFRVRAWWWS